jgi:hypothetical protein
LIDEYTLVYLSAVPSIARKVNEKLSLTASVALTYTDYEQIKAVPNIAPALVNVTSRPPQAVTASR